MSRMRVSRMRLELLSLCGTLVQPLVRIDPTTKWVLQGTPQKVSPGTYWTKQPRGPIRAGFCLQTPRFFKQSWDRPSQTAFQAQQGRVLSTDTQIFEEKLGLYTLARPALALPNSLRGPQSRAVCRHHPGYPSQSTHTQLPRSNSNAGLLVVSPSPHQPGYPSQGTNACLPRSPPNPGLVVDDPSTFTLTSSVDAPVCCETDLQNAS